MNRSTAFWPTGVALSGLLLIVSGCGYRMGAPYSAQVRSIYVPTFQTNSFRRGIELQLTEAVHKQIQMRTPFRLVKEPEADTKLTGRIISAEKRVLGETRFDDARELQLDLQVEVTWEDLRTGKILAQQRVPVPSSLSLPPDVIQKTAQSEFAPEVGQSLGYATQQAVERMARDIVSMMEMPGD